MKSNPRTFCRWLLAIGASLPSSGCVGSAQDDGGTPAPPEDATTDVGADASTDGAIPDGGTDGTIPDSGKDAADASDAGGDGPLDGGVDSGPIDAGTCGDGVRGTGEECDGPDLGGATCTSVLGAGAGGALACGATCALDVTGCSYPGLETGAPWPMLQADPGHRSRSAYRGPAAGTIAWSAPASVQLPVVSASGTLYGVQASGAAVAIRPEDGSIAWSHAPSMPNALFWNTPSLGNGTIYVPIGSGPSPNGPDYDLSVIGLTSSGDETWREVGFTATAVTIGLNGLYFGYTQRIHLYGGPYEHHLSLGNRGVLVSTTTSWAGLPPPITVDPTGLALVLSYQPVDGALTTLTAYRDAGVVWTCSADRGSEYSAGVEVGDDGTVYITRQGRLLALDPATGAEKWSSDAGIVAVGKNGTVLVLGSATITALSSSGSVLWQVPLSAHAIAVDRAGVAYVALDGNRIAAIEPTAGASLWTLAMPASVSWIVIGGENRLYAGAGGSLYSIGPPIPACTIDGTVYRRGAVNPANSCQICQPATSETSWTTANDGTTCAYLGTCASGICVSDDGVTNCGALLESCNTSLAVAGGTFFRTYANSGGGPTGEADPATVSAFQLDKYEVTVGRFRRFVAAWAGGWRPVAGAGRHTYLRAGLGLEDGANPGTYEWGWSTAFAAYVAPTNANLACDPFATWTPSVGVRERVPVNCVNWYEAYAFCIWDGGFLPTAAEWEYAAAGGDEQRMYPWGSTDPGTANYYAIYHCWYNGTGRCQDAGDVAPVGRAVLGAGRWFQLDLAGEVAEWNLDTSATYANPCTDCYQLNPPTKEDVRAVKGGNFTCESSALYPPIPDDAAPANRSLDIGFRCARSP